ncbi:hypothetical protein [Nocardia abscessus]|uniref:hypothetical protein n=1 Tax=Nocardia abscessus TaxID=120957 RepID=UPI001E4205B5|nr:hypothetical protein [Nocardia abscessus]
MWLVVDEADRAQWEYTPFEHVGPLRFDMSHEEASAAMRAQGFDGEIYPGSPRHPGLDQRADFRPATGGRYLPAVTVYYNTEGMLASVAVEAGCGPQVWMDGLRLVGRVPSELTDQWFEYAAEHGVDLTMSGDGDAASDELGFTVLAQRVGDILLTRPFFVIPERSWANTVYDSLPGDETRLL